MHFSDRMAIGVLSLAIKQLTWTGLLSHYQPKLWEKKRKKKKNQSQAELIWRKADRKSHGRRNLVGCSPWGRYTFTFHFHTLEEEMATHSSVLCLENPRDGGAWWAAVYGVAQSRTRLKRLSSSSNRFQSKYTVSLTQFKKNISVRKMHWLAHGLRKIKFRKNQEFSTEKWREKKKVCHLHFISSGLLVTSGIPTC